MPIYEYECPTCGVFEKHQKITAPPLEACGTCGKPVRRLVSATSFALKGGGWYQTDYGGKKSDSGSTGGDSGGGVKADAAGGCGAAACGTGACAGASRAEVN